MRFKIVILMAVAGLLGACSTAPTSETAAVSGAGATTSSAPAAAPTPAPAQAPAIEPGSEQDLKVNVGDRVFFAFDRYDLRPDARATLQKQATWLKVHQSVTITVEGHADERGTREYNLALGERRANSAADYLKSLGVEGSRIAIISYGKERPVDPASNEAAWAKNRRAVTVVN